MRDLGNRSRRVYCIVLPRIRQDIGLEWICCEYAVFKRDRGDVTQLVGKIVYGLSEGQCEIDERNERYEHDEEREHSKCLFPTFFDSFPVE